MRLEPARCRQRHLFTCCRYTEAFAAETRSLEAEQGEVSGVSIIAYDVNSAGGVVLLFYHQHLLLLLLLLPLFA